MTIFKTVSNTCSLVFHDTMINNDFVISKLETGQKRVASCHCLCSVNVNDERAPSFSRVYNRYK